MLEGILDLLPTGVIVRDRDGSFVFANLAARAIDLEGCDLVASALREPGVAFVTVREGRQICTIALRDAVVTFIATPQDGASGNVLPALFGLTPTETRIARVLSAGNTAPDVARVLGLSPHTVHSHLKSIFGKTGASSQNELIAMIRGGLDLLGSPSIKGCANNHDLSHSAPSVQKASRRHF